MNAIYILNGGLAFFRWYGPFCTDRKLYPPCMTVAAILYLVNAGYHRYLHNNHYFLEWKEMPDKDDKESSFDVSCIYGEEQLDYFRKLFRAQCEAYSKYTLRVSVWNICIQIMAYVVTHNIDFLGCMENGYRWVYTSILGSLFTLFQMMSILMQTIMIMQMFYCVPQKLKLFTKERK
jgi:hypothetical protein